MLNKIVVNTVRAWMLEHGLNPSTEWDEVDGKCFQDSGEHTVWTVQAKAIVPIEEDDIREAFVNYFFERNKLPGAIQFYPYALQRYDCPCGCGTYYFASVYR